MIEALVFIVTALALGVAVFVGLVALLLFSVLVFATADKILWMGAKPWEPPKHMYEDAYKAQIQRIREAASHTSPVFRLMDDHDD